MTIYLLINMRSQFGSDSSSQFAQNGDLTYLNTYQEISLGHICVIELVDVSIN